MTVIIFTKRMKVFFFFKFILIEYIKKYSKVNVIFFLVSVIASKTDKSSPYTANDH